MACTTASLISAAQAFVCHDPATTSAMVLRMLCAIRDGETMACDPATLLADAKCILAQIPPRIIPAAAIPVLCDILANGGGGASGGGVQCGTGAPVAPPTTPSSCAFYMDESADALYYWNATAAEWRLLLA